MDNVSPSFLSLPDDDLMLLLCVRPENLPDPARWCHEMREYIRASETEPQTSQEAENLKARIDRLRAEADGE